MPSISDLDYDARQIRLGWDDGSQSILQAIWLRDHCQQPESRDPGNGQRLLNITDIPKDIRIASALLDQDCLLIEFAPDGHRSRFEHQWLRQNVYDLNPQHDDRSEAAKSLWHGASFESGLPRCDYADFQNNPARKREALQAVADFGFVLMDEVPCEDDQVLRVIGDFGFVRETNYGSKFEVRARVDANNLAYTNLGLGCHLDNPYRDPVPGLQLLHCLESSTEGGESILQDGFRAASLLRAENREHFETLSRNWINFRFTDSDTDLRSRVPFIEVNDLGQVIKVRFNNRSIDTIRLAPNLVEPFYAAYRHYAEILEREQEQIVFKLRPGQLMLFDNTRVLHARKAYSTGGLRHLQGAYSDLDGLYSCLAKLKATQAV